MRQRLRPHHHAGARRWPSRAVSGLAPTSTMTARPAASKWVQPAHPSSSLRQAAVTSGWRIRLLADQEAVHAQRRPAAPGRRGCACPLSPIRKRSGGTCGASSSRDVQVGLQRLEIAVVDADQLGSAGRARARSSRRVMHLDQHVHVERAGERSPARRACCVGQGGHDQQDAVGAHRAAFVDLPGVEDEVLAQHRQIDGGAGGAQMRRGCPGNAARRSAPTGRWRRRRDRRGRARRGRNRRGSGRRRARPS